MAEKVNRSASRVAGGLTGLGQGLQVAAGAFERRKDRKLQERAQRQGNRARKKSLSLQEQQLAQQEERFRLELEEHRKRAEEELNLQRQKFGLEERAFGLREKESAESIGIEKERLGLQKEELKSQSSLRDAQALKALGISKDTVAGLDSAQQGMVLGLFRGLVDQSGDARVRTVDDLINKHISDAQGETDGTPEAVAEYVASAISKKLTELAQGTGFANLGSEVKEFILQSQQGIVDTFGQAAAQKFSSMQQQAEGVNAQSLPLMDSPLPGHRSGYERVNTGQPGEPWRIDPKLPIQEQILQARAAINKGPRPAPGMDAIGGGFTRGARGPTTFRELLGMGTPRATPWNMPGMTIQPEQLLNRGGGFAPQNPSGQMGLAQQFGLVPPAGGGGAVAPPAGLPAAMGQNPLLAQLLGQQPQQDLRQALIRQLLQRMAQQQPQQPASMPFPGR